MTRAGAWLRGAGAAAAALYFLDPDSGARRRALVRDRIVHFARVARDEMEGDLRDARNRLRGVAAKTRRLAGSAGVDVADGDALRTTPAARLVMGLAALPLLPYVTRMMGGRTVLFGALGSAIFTAERARLRAMERGAASRRGAEPSQGEPGDATV